MSLYRQALKLTLNSLHTDRERHIMKEVLCLICASHNGVSESEVLDLFPEMEPPLLSSLLHRLTRVCVVTLRCGLIRFQHLQVTTPPPLPAVDHYVSLSPSGSTCLTIFAFFPPGLGGREVGVPKRRHQLCCLSRETHTILQPATQVVERGLP